jgi:hypothetical protein
MNPKTMNTKNTLKRMNGTNRRAPSPTAATSAPFEISDEITTTARINGSMRKMPIRATSTPLFDVA